MESSEPTGPALAVDVGGTKLAVGVVDPDGSVGWSTTVATPRTGDPETLWDVLAAAVLEALAAAGPGRGRPVACGAGCGGPMERGGVTVSPLHIPAWRGFPLRARLATLTGLDTRVDNDAKALALGEGRFGAAAGCDDYVSITVSTGIGGGIVVDGRLVGGRTGNAGPIGHLVVNPGGRRCACGGAGCLEAEASGTAIAEITGVPAAEAGPATVERTGRLVGRAVAGVANLCDLDLAVLAGSVALGYGDPFFSAARDEMSATARLPFTAACRIVPSPLGPAAGLLGAAALAWAAVA